MKIYLKYKIQNMLSYAFILFAWFLTVIYGTDRIVRLGRNIIKKYEDKAEGEEGNIK